MGKIADAWANTSEEPDIWDSYFSGKFPDKDKIRQQYRGQTGGDGTAMRHYLGRVATAEDLEKKRAKIYERWGE